MLVVLVVMAVKSVGWPVLIGDSCLGCNNDLVNCSRAHDIDNDNE